MKRLLSLSIAFLIILMLPTVSMAQSGGEEHLLWGIPFGITPQECQALARENTGLVLVSPSGEPIHSLLPHKSQPVSVHGYPADIAFAFEDNAYSTAWITYEPEHGDEPLQGEALRSHVRELFAMYASLAGLYTAEYGTPDQAMLITAVDALGEAVYAMPLGENGPDTELLQLAYDDCGTIAALLVYENILLGFQATDTGRDGMSHPNMIVLRYTTSGDMRDFLLDFPAGGEALTEYPGILEPLDLSF